MKMSSKKPRTLIVTLALIVGLMMAVGVASAQTAVPWGEYAPPESFFKGMDLQGSYQYYNDQFTDDRGNIAHGNAKARYWQFQDSEMSGYDINLAATIATTGDVDLSYNAGGHSNFKRYFAPGSDNFYFGGLQTGATSAATGYSVVATAGVGVGRFQDVTTLGRASQIERKLMEIGDITTAIGGPALIAIARESERRVAMDETLTQRARRVADLIEQRAGVSLSPEGVLEVRNILSQTGKLRTYGWEAKAGVGYPLSVPAGQTSEINVVGQAGIGMPVGLDTQFNGSAQIAMPLGGGSTSVGVQGELTHSLTDRIKTGTYLNYSVQTDSTGSSSGWGAGVSSNFQIQDNLSLLLSVDLGDATNFEESTIDFNAAISYRFF